MKPFEHFNAKTAEEAASLLRKYEGKAKVIAGGTDLLGTLEDNIQPTYPQALVNLKTIQGLDSIKENSTGLNIGALVKLADIAESTTIKEKYVLIAQAAEAVAMPQIRNMGTIGGNLCQDIHCLYYRYPHHIGGRVVCLRKGGSDCNALTGDNRYDSIFGGPEGCYATCTSDTAPALIAMGATAITTKKNIPLESFFTPLPGVALDADEILTEIQVPQPREGLKGTYLKFSLRKAIDFAIISVACAITLEGGICKETRIVLGGVAPVPWRATGAEEAIKGKTIDSTRAEEAGRAAVAHATPLSMNEYKVWLTQSLVKRAILASI
ncbi:FAD binding domain-containing protein [Chloroflexota bacterium]